MTLERFYLDMKDHVCVIYMNGFEYIRISSKPIQHLFFFNSLWIPEGYPKEDDTNPTLTWMLEYGKQSSNVLFIPTLRFLRNGWRLYAQIK